MEMAGQIAVQVLGTSCGIRAQRESAYTQMLKARFTLTYGWKKCLKSSPNNFRALQTIPIPLSHLRIVTVIDSQVVILVQMKPVNPFFTELES